MANDLNGEIVNLFRILQRHHQQLLDVMRFQIASRRDFERLRDTNPRTLTELERAARFLYLQRLAFGGHVRGVFGVAPDQAARFTLSRLEPILEAAHDRLEAVVFESLDWADLIPRYDGPATLFYLDPPYFGGEDDYGKGMFDRGQYARMADALAEMSGAFILSINDRPEIRDLFGRFHVETVALKYSVSSEGPTDARELIVSNRETPTRLL